MRPFYARASLPASHVLFCYRRFRQHQPGTSHDGLGVNACHMSKVLRAHGVRADVADTWQLADLQTALQKMPTVTHCVIEAIWVSADNLVRLIEQFPHVHFLTRNHSQLSFLQVEPGAVKLIDDYLQLQAWQPAFAFTSNSERYCQFVSNGYGQKCLWLPNLYPLCKLPPPKNHSDRLLKIGSFGALRLMKNHLCAAGAALEIARRLGRQLEFHVNSGRDENGGKTVLDAIRNLLAGVKGAALVEFPWSTWPQFRRFIATMDLCIQVSWSETFNLVTADATAEGVPSVVGSAIEWAPKRWQADTDDPGDVARVGAALLADRLSAADGFQALSEYQDRAVRQWLNYLASNPAA